MSNRKITILVGPSCSYKSTTAKKVLSTDNTVILCRDTERENLFFTYRMRTKQEEDLITNILRRKVKNALEQCYDVILDNTHLKLKYINQVINDYNTLADIELYVMQDWPLEILLERNKKRAKETGKFIPEDVIDRQVQNFRQVLGLINSDLLSLSYPKVENNE